MSADPGSRVLDGDASLLGTWATHLAAFPSADVERTALRHRSLAFRDVLAHAATRGTHDWKALADRLRAGDPPALDPARAASLALVVGAQDLADDDIANAVALYRAACAQDDRLLTDDRHRVHLAELLLAAGDVARARRIVEAAPAGAEGLTHLRLDVLDPHVPGRRPGPGDREAWARGFAALFTEHGLEAPAVRDGDGPAFDRLGCRPARTTGSGPLVSVIMTTFRPDATFRTSLASILAQSWTNLEVIVVDDASGPDHGDLLAEAAAQDPRVRVVRREVNGGTYLARNDGLAAAGGTFVTGQDSDDWSHPRRIERQVAALVAHPDAPGVRSHQFTVSPDLVFHRRGIPPRRVSQISLMLRRDTVVALGGYAPARRSADVELAERVEAAARRGLVTLPEPLLLARVLPGSLSRSDFRAGWHHPARLAMRASWTAWHRRVRRGEADAVTGPDAPLVVPRAYRPSPAEPPAYDVVVLGDWRRPTDHLADLLVAARAMVADGLVVGLWQVDDPADVRGGTPTYCDAVGQAANDGVVDLVVPDEPATCRLLVVDDPVLLQFFPATPVAIRPQDVVVLPSRSALPHSTAACARTLAAALGRPVDPAAVDGSAVPEDVPGPLRPFLGTRTTGASPDEDGRA